MRALRVALPHTWIVYGGVFPTYHWEEIMEQEPGIDFIVRGEGEETIVRLVTALELSKDLEEVRGIVFRAGTVPAPRRLAAELHLPAGPVVATPPAPVIRDLDACRVGWELIDHRHYSYWGNRRAVVVQFSRGCPHHCQYCGQRDFWRTWRHRDPVKFAAELARLHREQGVEVINFADENPTASRAAWQAFLEALIAENVPLILVGSTRASDIVRDADILHLYKRAGVARFLLGIESTDENTLQAIRKGSTRAIDREAIRLLRKHQIISMAAWVADFKQATDRDYWRALRQILSYDPDQIQALYATPHGWTPYAKEQADRRVIQTDLGRWDYKHQVLESRSVPNWRVLLWVKVIEAVAQMRPRSLFRVFAHPDRGFRAAMRWYYSIGRRVWPYELWHWLFLDRRTGCGPRLVAFLEGGWREKLRGLHAASHQGEPQDRKPIPRQVPGGMRAAGISRTADIHQLGCDGPVCRADIPVCRFWGLSSRQPTPAGLSSPANRQAGKPALHQDAPCGAQASQPWPVAPELVSSSRMDHGERAAVSEELEPVCPT